MKTELRNIKYSSFASQETNCFEATVYIDGVKSGTVRNDGHGGCDYFHPHELHTKLAEHCKTLPPVQFQGHTLEMSPDLLIGELFEVWLAERHLKSLMKNKVVFVSEPDGALMNTTKLTPERLAMYQALSEADRCAKIKDCRKTLNWLPLTEAVAIYRKRAS